MEENRRRESKPRAVVGSRQETTRVRRGCQAQEGAQRRGRQGTRRAERVPGGDAQEVQPVRQVPRILLCVPARGAGDGARAALARRGG